MKRQCCLWHFSETLAYHTSRHRHTHQCSMLIGMWMLLKTILCSVQDWRVNVAYDDHVSGSLTRQCCLWRFSETLARHTSRTTGRTVEPPGRRCASTAGSPPTQIDTLLRAGRSATSDPDPTPWSLVVQLVGLQHHRHPLLPGRGGLEQYDG